MSHSDVSSSDGLPHEAMQAYLAKFPDWRRELQAHLAHNESTELAALLQSLKGTGTTYGFPELSELAGAALAKLQNGQSTRAVAREIISIVRLMFRAHPDQGGIAS